MIKSAGCDLNSKGDLLEFHEIYPNSKWYCQKKDMFTPEQIQLEENFLKVKRK